MFEKIALVQQTNKKIYFCKQPKKRVLIIIIYVFIHKKKANILLELDLMLTWQFELQHDVV